MQLGSFDVAISSPHVRYISICEGQAKGSGMLRASSTGCTQAIASFLTSIPCLLCRHEWNRQQPARSASLQRAAKVRDWSLTTCLEPPKWVPSLAGAHSFTYLLCREPNGVISVLDANAPSPQPKRLAFTSCADLITYMGRDGHLRILATYLNVSGVISWHTTDLATSLLTADSSGAWMNISQKQCYNDPGFVGRESMCVCAF